MRRLDPTQELQVVLFRVVSCRPSIPVLRFIRKRARQYVRTLHLLNLAPMSLIYMSMIRWAGTCGLVHHLGRQPQIVTSGESLQHYSTLEGHRVFEMTCLWSIPMTHTLPVVSSCCDGSSQDFREKHRMMHGATTAHARRRWLKRQL